MRGILVSIIIVIIFGATAVMLWLREKKRTDKIIGELDTYYSLLKEKRKTVRLNKRIGVVCKVMERPESHWSAFSKDISGEGIGLYLPEILPEDAVVELEINIPGEKPLTARGMVVWIKEVEATDKDGKRQFNAGIKFTKIRPEDKDILFKFIEGSLTQTERSLTG